MLPHDCTLYEINIFMNISNLYYEYLKISEKHDVYCEFVRLNFRRQHASATVTEVVNTEDTGRA